MTWQSSKSSDWNVEPKLGHQQERVTCHNLKSGAERMEAGETVQLIEIYELMALHGITENIT